MTPRTPPGSSVVLLESEGTEAEAAMHADLHGAAIAALARDHLETLERRRGALERRLRAAEHAGVQMQGQLETLAAEAGRLNAEEKVLAGQLLALRDWLAATERQSTDEALAGLRETRAMSATRRSDVALGPSRMVVVGGGTMGSLLAGILAAIGAGLMRPGALRP
jgi:pyruvate/2-oxoglutarate dehydrogenase complex dihydrolipoamide dehydrogenase (E3) component